VSIRFPNAMLEQLKAATLRLGLRGYQTLVKHILRGWLDSQNAEPVPETDAVSEELPADVPPVVVATPRTRRQLLTALSTAIKRQEDAASRNAADEVQMIGDEIERIRYELSDLEDAGD
jgi:hypothetical protein